jgi:hypothetical protein
MKEMFDPTSLVTEQISHGCVRACSRRNEMVLTLVDRSTECSTCPCGAPLKEWLEMKPTLVVSCLKISYSTYSGVYAVVLDVPRNLIVPCKGMPAKEWATAWC